MQPKHHLLIGTAATAVLLPAIGPVGGASFLVASVLLIDLDHYLDFLIHNRFRSFSVRKMLLYHKHLFLRIKRPDFLGFDVFHTVEFLACMTGFSFWFDAPLLKAITAGMTLHFLSDLIYLKWIGAFSARAHSVVEYLIRKRSMTRRGIVLEQPYQEVLDLIKSA